MTTAYDFAGTAADGKQVPLQDYEGKVLLIVNVASKCGLTPQYQGLESLYREHKDHGVEILGFPCNQFLEQEPGSDEEIQDFCKSAYDVTFPVFAKIEVNGSDADPLYRWLRAQAPGDFGPRYGGFYDAIVKIRPDAEGTDEVKWNFTKFLIGRDGQVIKRYEPPVLPAEITADLENYL
ncbi:MAG: glutathione peroxidase [Streptosporangiaceae bacterium]